MKQIGLLTILGIELIIGIFAAEGTYTPRNNQECGLEFPSIEFNTITVSWNRKCFDEDSSYTLVVNGKSLCEKNNINENFCTEESCQIATINMGCSANPISGCVPVTFTVTGNTYANKTSENTTAAPIFSDVDWNLEASVEGQTLTAKWGPLNGDYVSCATRALITATCGNLTKHNTTDTLDPSLRSTGQLSLAGCPGGDITLATVTYLSNNDVHTERKKSYVGGLMYIAAPDAPLVTSVLGNDDTPTSLSVTWEKPTTPEGAEEVIGYTITYTDGTPVDVYDADAVSYNLNNLTACTDYTVFVAAKWSNGTGEYGNNKGKTGSKAPGKPTSVTSGSIESTKILVSWKASEVINTCPLTPYTVNWIPAEGDGSGEHVGVDLSTNYTITGLAGNTAYTITITANTENGKTAESDEYVHTTASQGLEGWEIALIVIGVVLFVAIVVAILVCWFKKLLCFKKLV